MRLEPCTYAKASMRHRRWERERELGRATATAVASQRQRRGCVVCYPGELEIFRSFALFCMKKYWSITRGTDEQPARPFRVHTRTQAHTDTPTYRHTGRAVGRSGWDKTITRAREIYTRLNIDTQSDKMYVDIIFMG